MKRFRFRSAVTGRFVRRLFALLNPFSTVRERVGLRVVNRTGEPVDIDELMEALKNGDSK